MKKTKRLRIFTTLILVVLSLISMLALPSCLGSKVDFDKLNYLEDIVMTANKTIYLPAEASVDVLWINNTESSLTLGDYFYLVKKNRNSWQKVLPKSSTAFYDIGHIVSAGGLATHTYNLNAYYNNLKEGTYRIVTNYYAGGGGAEGIPNEYSLYVEITLTKNLTTLENSQGYFFRTYRELVNFPSEHYLSNSAEEDTTLKSF